MQYVSASCGQSGLGLVGRIMIHVEKRERAREGQFAVVDVYSERGKTESGVST